MTKYSSEYAPIVLFVYNRVEHTKKLIESLLKNAECKDSCLYIFADGPKNANDIKVEAVRRYITSIRGFNHIEIIFEEKNKGLANSVINGVTQVIRLYGKAIILEDDLYVSRYFLRYMNEALNRYADEKNIYAITGYNHSKYNPTLPQCSFIRYTESWSWATWSDRWELFDSNALGWERLLSDSKMRRKFNFGGYDYSGLLIKQMNDDVDSWAVKWAWTLYINDGYYLIPNMSLCYNSGLDGTGAHCGDDASIGNFELSNEVVTQWPNPVSIDHTAECYMDRYLRHSLFRKKVLKNPIVYAVMHPIHSIKRVVRVITNR